MDMDMRSAEAACGQRRRNFGVCLLIVRIPRLNVRTYVYAESEPDCSRLPTLFPARFYFLCLSLRWLGCSCSESEKPNLDPERQERGTSGHMGHEHMGILYQQGCLSKCSTFPSLARRFAHWKVEGGRCSLLPSFPFTALPGLAGTSKYLCRVSPLTSQSVTLPTAGCLLIKPPPG